MRDAVEALAKRKFGEGGVFNPSTPGSWSDSSKVRGSANPYTEEFKECVALQAQYIYDTYGKFPGTIQSIFCFMYVQAQHLDLDFYDHYFNPRAYLTTHKEHMKMASNIMIARKRSKVSKHLFTLQSFPINKLIHVFFSIVRYIQMIKCEHCDVKARYRLSIEDFNSAHVYSADLCIDCITIEESKIAGDFLVTKSLKIEPLLPVLNRLPQK